jgi:TonB-dependent starch-binding outer membrane protein SusC
MQNKLLKILTLICFIVVTFPAVLNAQQLMTVTGTVTDDTGAPLPGASVVVKGTTIGTASGIDGTFSLKVPEGTTILLVSFIGMEPQEVTITSGPMKITMVAAKTLLDEVVVVGYGTMRRSEVSSAISSVSNEQIKNLSVTGADQALQGKVAGITVQNNSGQPGGGVSVRVRGITTINSNDPLIVIDGVPFTSNTVSNDGYDGLGGSDGQTGNSFLATLNPNDIESIDVLKDASAQAIYGSQAANGVIIVTTKKGKAGEGKIAYNFNYGVAGIAKKLDVMNLRQFATYQNIVSPLLGLDTTEEFADPSLLGKGTDWQDAIFRKGITMDHQLSFSGGNNKTNYYLSAGYFNQTGILIGSDFDRYTTRFNLEDQVKSWLKIGVSSNLTRSIQNVTLADAAESTIWWAVLESPLIPVKNIDGTWAGNNSVGNYTYSQDNPVALSRNRGNTSTINQVFGSIYADVQLSKGLSVHNEVSYQFNNQLNTAFQNAANIGTRSLQSKLIDTRSTSYYWALRNYLNYNKVIRNKHNISITAGHEAQYSYWSQISGKKVDLQNNIIDLSAGSTDQTTWNLTGGKSDWAMESYFIRGNYNYSNKYTLSISYRADGSSNFGPNNKWGYFPGASAGWIVSNEAFAESFTNIVNYLKVRVGYGAVGNQNLPSGAPNPPYTASVTFWPGATGFGTVGSVSTNFIAGIANPDLSWESVITENAGIDLSFLKSKIEATVDIYKKTTSDMLLYSTGPSLLGIGDQWDDLKAPIGNVGKMTNTGIDISITSHNISKKDFEWTTTFIFSHFKNKLNKLINNSSSIDGKVYYNNYLITHTTPGGSVGRFYGLKTDGLFRTQEDLDVSKPQFGYAVTQNQTWLGDVRFKDVSGPTGSPDNVIDANDYTYIGSPLPKFTFGLTNSFTYKNFDLSIFLQGSYGADIFNFMKWQLTKMNNGYYNQSTDCLDMYTSTNTGAKLPRFTSSNTNNTAMSDRYIEDGSYLRIQNITLGYRLPKELISKIRMTSLRAFVSVQNLYTFTKYSGYDPEIGAYNNSITLMNVDMGHYPNPRTVSCGLNVEF